MLNELEQNSTAAQNENSDKFVIKVLKSKEFYDLLGDQTPLLPYPTRSKDRGLLFLVNNNDFGGKHLTRSGSENDYNNLINLFHQLNFKIECFQNLTLKEMEEKVAYIQKHDMLRKIDCFFTVIMSHGAKGFEPDSTDIITTDNHTIPTFELIEKFNNLNCPQLTRKPKVFIFQLCRGDREDFGVLPTRIQCQMHTDISGDSVIPIITDELLCFSTLPGYKAHRDAVKGAWYIQEICEAFMKYAHNTDVEKLFKIVADKIGGFRSSKGTMQTPSFRNNNFRDLFLHPGIYEENGELKYFKDFN